MSAIGARLPTLIGMLAYWYLSACSLALLVKVSGLNLRVWAVAEAAKGRCWEKRLTSWSIDVALGGRGGRGCWSMFGCVAFRF